MAVEESFDDLEEWIDSVKPKILAESFEAEYERKYETKRTSPTSDLNKSFGEEFEDLKIWAMERGQQTLSICKSRSEKENVSKPLFFRYVLSFWSSVLETFRNPQNCCSFRFIIIAMFLVSAVIITHQTQSYNLFMK